MKKIVLTLLAGCLMMNVYAQEFTSKNGHQVLPQAGNWGVGIQATPFLNYFGNFLNGSTNNSAPNFNSAANPAIFGKYFVDANTAYRVSFALNTNSTTRKFSVNNDANTGPTPSYVEDKVVNSSTSVILGAGIEKRRGEGRLQGVYGAEASVGFGSSRTKHEFGNALNTTTETRTTGIPGQPSGAVGGEFVTEVKSGTSISVGVGAFIGVEYFVAPRLSIGGEVGYGLAISTLPTGSTTVEFVDSGSVQSSSRDSFGTGSFGLGTTPSGSLRANFYF